MLAQQFIKAEIKLLEAYREELQNEIEVLNARIKKLRLARSHNHWTFCKAYSRSWEYVKIRS
jgi:hypothetical protein